MLIECRYLNDQQQRLFMLEAGDTRWTDLFSLPSVICFAPRFFCFFSLSLVFY